ncbi:MAG TPA: PLP-dependent transferase, partial [Acidimicrobiales bacterium]|nr:PLP-dependent transferase [Acidimicrobiales bacterium]
MTDHQPPTPAADRGLHSQTRAIRSGRRGDDRSLAPVLWATSTFWSSSVDEARKMATMAGADRFYSRYGNPTVGGFEDLVGD